MKKRLLSLILAFALSLSLFSAAFAAPTGVGLSNFKKVNTYTEGQFSDVAAKAWYAPNVKSSFELGLVNGTGDGKFTPDGYMKISEAIALAVRIHSTYHTGSADMGKSSPWYQAYVDYAVKNGIIEDGEYEALTVEATRAQYAKILAASVPESVLNPINDIPVGSIHDLPANTDYAEAVYRLYNAGVLTGSDDYGTFKANTGIKRSEATALATRIVDPALRREFTPKTYDPYPPTGVLIRDGMVSQSTKRVELAVGQSTRLLVNLTPSNAYSGIVWTSSDPAVASIDEYGTVIAHGQGTVTITAKTYNGITDTFEVGVPNGPAELQYELTSDGTGYEIIGCDTAAYSAYIPATYNGLPVVSIKPGAFKDCLELRAFTVDNAQAVFYEEDGVVFTDTPAKTLVVFPPNYDAYEYCVPEGTVAIAPYAFASTGGSPKRKVWEKELRELTLPDGVKELGDCAFAEVRRQIGVYIPNSLTVIGKNLMQSQKANVAFYGDRRSAFAQYAKSNSIPFSGIVEKTPDTQTVLTNKPEHISGTGLVPAQGERRIVDYYQERGSYFLTESEMREQVCNISDQQINFSGEVFLLLESRWTELVPDVNGDIRVDFTPQTGLYGAGYTEGEAVLRAYDRYGNLIAMQEINGNFSFCFPGAANLGVEGGNGTMLTALPVEPVYLSSGGIYPLQPENCYETADGNLLQFFVLQYPYGSLSPEMPNHLNSFSGGVYDCTGDTSDIVTHYGIAFVRSHNANQVEKMNQCSFVFTGMECVQDTDELLCLVSSGFAGIDTFGQTASSALDAVKRTMIGNYYPEHIPVHKITIIADGSYPSATRGIIYLDESSMKNLNTLAHEMVHAVDQGIEAVTPVAPSAWMEGRAEYIAAKVCEEVGVEYRFSYDASYDEYDWSYLSEADKADFFSFYYFSTNRYTTYPVGYFFLCYLNETYGEGVSAEIMANIAELTEYARYQWSEANAPLFKQCVEAATEVGVFQNFVRDVIEK